MQQAEDFRAENHALAALIAPLDAAGLARVTQFKGWRIEDVVGHLHMFNIAALETLQGDTAFGHFFAPFAIGMGQGKTLLELQTPWLDGLCGRALVEAWQSTAEQVGDAYASTDPKRRVKWAGPDMSALSSITSRQMETWAHGQEVFDLLGLAREEHDRIRNIAHLGVATFGWSYACRGLDVPAAPPHVRLHAPSGAIWDWNEGQEGGLIEGTAVEFAQVVTQVRNIADTSLLADGPVAREWMAIAQCFAGPVAAPPAPGTRYRNTLARASE